MSRFPFVPYKLLILLFAFVLPLSGIGQQVGPSLSKKAISVKQKVDSLTPNAKISVVRYRAEEEFGTFLSHDGQGFTFHDVDRKMDVTLRYEEVKKIKDGYAGYNYATHRHVDRTRSLIVVGLAVAALGAVLGLLAAAPN